jgi:adenylosuccinate lyase
MPHKRNPERSEHLVTLARLARVESGVLLESMVVEHERDGRAWKAEWAAFPDLCRLAAASLALGRAVVEGLVVDPAAMAANLGARGGYVLSERVMHALSERVGKQSAHLLVYEACMAGVDQGLSLREALAAAPEIGKHLSAAELDALCDPAGAVDQAPEVTDEILTALERSRALDPPEWP